MNSRAALADVFQFQSAAMVWRPKNSAIPRATGSGRREVPRDADRARIGQNLESTREPAAVRVECRARRATSEFRENLELFYADLPGGMRRRRSWSPTLPLLVTGSNVVTDHASDRHVADGSVALVLAFMRVAFARAGPGRGVASAFAAESRTGERGGPHQALRTWPGAEPLDSDPISSTSNRLCWRVVESEFACPASQLRIRGGRHTPGRVPPSWSAGGRRGQRRAPHRARPPSRAWRWRPPP